MSNAGSKVGIYTTENRWGGPQFKRVGPAFCGTLRDGTPSNRAHSWYRWQPTLATESDADDPWAYMHECQMMGCDAKEYAADLPELHDILDLVGFLDQCGVPANESLLDRVRDFYHRCTDAVNKYRDRMGELPFIIDPREAPYVAGWLACLVYVVEGAADVKDPRDPTGRAAALFAFRRWADDEDKKKGFPPQVP